MKNAGLAVISVVLALGASAARACNFEYDPISVQQYYREQGWTLPGIKHLPASGRRSAGNYGLTREPVPGLGANIVEFPPQEFIVQGGRKKMRAMQARVRVVRWMMNGRTVGYAYELSPVMARRVQGEWVVEGALACDFWATFVDDKGDGVFRVLAPVAFRDELVPLWAKRRED